MAENSESQGNGKNSDDLKSITMDKESEGQASGANTEDVAQNGDNFWFLMLCGFPLELKFLPK